MTFLSQPEKPDDPVIRATPRTGLASAALLPSAIALIAYAWTTLGSVPV